MSNPASIAKTHWSFRWAAGSLVAVILFGYLWLSQAIFGQSPSYLIALGFWSGAVSTVGASVVVAVRSGHIFLRKRVLMSRQADLP